MRIAIIGATGLVGGVMLKVLEERNVQVDELFPVGSEASIGKTVVFKGKPVKVLGVAQVVSLKPDVALFSAGGNVSKQWAPKFAAVGTIVIDNSSAWRMDADKKLVVPEVNGNLLSEEDRIIANPNCSTIQLVMVLKELNELLGIKRVVVSTYQSVTGTGVKAVKQLEAEREGKTVEDPAYPHPIDKNCIPHCDVFMENGYTKEEMKLVHESRKILELPELRLTATSVRVPLSGGHSESVNIEFEDVPNLNEIRSRLNNADGITVVDNPSKNLYPMPVTSESKDDVFVGRIRLDESQPNSINLWIVSDNLRKGAATNAVQILETLQLKGIR
ncbi:MAG: aspartate-semialdehyde dehydrogenase [Oceanospirillaceae bacterium]|jgi:aspartate-semialdehyde dehydrogenase